MLKKLKKCKTFGEIYNCVGEANWGKAALYLLILLCISPLIAGIINYVMLLQITYYYDAYEYNYRFMAVSNMVFSLITVFFFTYIIGKIRYNKWYIEDVLMKIRKKEPWLLFWICLLIWGIASCLASANIRGAFFGATELSSGYISHVYMLCVMGCAYLVDEYDRKKLIRIFIIVSNILAFIMLSFQYDIPFISGFTAATGCSVFTNSNHYGYYLAVASLCIAGMLFIESENKKFDKKTVAYYSVSFAIHMWALMINDTLGAYFGVVFGLLGLMILWRIRTGKLGLIRWIPVIMVIVFTLLSFGGVITSKLGSTIGPSLVIFIRDLFKVAEKTEGYEQAGTNRIKLWKDTIAAIKLRPVLGYGPDIMYDRWYQYVIGLTPHNEYLECTFFLGIPGGIMYLGGLVSLLICRIKELKKLPLFTLMSAGAVIAYLVSAFFGVRKYHTVVYLFMFLGFILSKKKDEK